MKRNNASKFVLAAALMAGMSAWALQFKFECDRTDAIYAVGQDATITVKATDDNGAPATAGSVDWRLDNFGDAELQKGVQDIASGATFTLKGSLKEPGFLRVVLRERKKGSRPVYFGVAYDPQKIKAGAPRPKDFNAFWENAVKNFDATVTEPIAVKPMEGGDTKDCRRYELVIPTVGGRKLYGFLSEPKDLSKGPYPVLVSVPGAGPSTYGITGDAKTIRLVVNVHYYRPLPGKAKKSPEQMALQKKEDAEWARKFPVKNVRYTQTGIASSREDYFYYGVILGVNRAVNWLAERPGVDKTRFRYNGGSQGGGFGLILCGLNRNFNRATIYVPAITDLLGFKAGNRESGWPRLIEAQLDENKAAAERNAPYFDGVNFAYNIDFPVRLEVGSADIVCPPMAGWSAFNVIPSKDKDIFIGIGQGHAPQAGIKRKMSEWLLK